LEDNFDEIAQKKDLSGFVIILCYYLISVIASIFSFNITCILCIVVGYPIIMILGVILLENYSRSFRNLMYNIRWLKLKYTQKDKYDEYLKIRKGKTKDICIIIIIINIHYNLLLIYLINYLIIYYLFNYLYI